MNMQSAVEAFHRAMGLPVGDRKHPAMSRVNLRIGLIDEERDELARACFDSDLIGAIDALVDLLYVTFGAAVEWGIDLQPFFAEVHAANMRKLGGPVREDGKKLKPKGWSPPDIAGVLKRELDDDE
jgi:predicted HAD superfamily Cof-like phosphohydrolase